MRLALIPALGLLAATAAAAQDRPRLVPQAEAVWLPDLTFRADGDRLLTVNRTGGAALLQSDAQGRAALWDLAAGRALAWLPPEAEATGRGLLTFALVDNGLLAGQADADGRVTLAEWLGYGVERVPGLAAEGRAGAVETYGRGGVRARRMTDEETAEAPGLQTPALFDFRRDPPPVPVAGRR